MFLLSKATVAGKHIPSSVCLWTLHPYMEKIPCMRPGKHVHVLDADASHTNDFDHKLWIGLSSHEIGCCAILLHDK